MGSEVTAGPEVPMHIDTPRYSFDRERRGRLFRAIVVTGAAVLLPMTAAAQITDIECSDPSWIMFTINFDRGADPNDPFGSVDTDQAPYGGNLPTGAVIAGQTVLGFDTSDSTSAAQQHTDPTAPNFQPYNPIGVYFQVLDPGGSCPSQGNNPEYGVGTIFDSTWSCSGSNNGCDPDLGSPNNQCVTPGPGAGNSGNPNDPGANCDFPEKEAAPPANQFPKDIVTNVLVVQEIGPAGGSNPSCPWGSQPAGRPSNYCPDDCGGGGTILVTYSDLAPIEFLRSSHVDFELEEQLDINIYADDAGTDLIGDAADVLGGVLPNGSGTGDNAWAEVNGQQALINIVCDGASGNATTLADCSDAEKTRLRSGRRVEFVFPGSGAIDSFTFCFNPSTTPVTVSSFEARRAPGGTLFRWTTATEMATAGFHIEQKTGHFFERITERIVPSHTTDSTGPQSYEVFVPGATGDIFRLVDVETTQRERRHGPFEIGERHGAAAHPAEIDWPSIRSEHRAKLARRHTESHLKGGSEPAAYLRVSESGLHRVSYEQLAAAGIDLAGVDADEIALTIGGSPVAVRVETQGSGVFGPGAFAEFHGEATKTLYSATSVYRLARDPDAAMEPAVDFRVPGGFGIPDAFLETLEFDRDRAYAFTSPSGDPWYDTRLLAFPGTPAVESFTFEIDDVAMGAAHLELIVWGVTNWLADLDHHLRAEVNGVEVADEWFDGSVNFPLSIELPAGLLVEGANTLTLSLPGDTGVDFDMVNFDRFSLSYPRALVAAADRLAIGSTMGGANSATDGIFADGFGTGDTSCWEGGDCHPWAVEVSGFSSPDIVVYRFDQEGATLVTGALVSPAGGEYSVRFPAAAEARHEVAAAAAMLIPEIVSEPPFEPITGGPADYLVISHPDFIADLAPLVQARLAQGLAVKVVDIEQVYAQFGHGGADPEAVRAYIAHAVDAMETQMVLLVGGDTYDYTDNLGLGSVSFVPTFYTDTGNGAFFTPSDSLYADVDGDRVPDVAIGRLPVRSSAELTNLIAKTLDYDLAPTELTTAVAADNSEAQGPFGAEAEELIALMPAEWQVTRAFLDDLPIDEARDNLIQAINNGVRLTTFVGHSGPSTWTFDGLLTADDVDGLQNGGVPTVVSQWGCWNTYHVQPEYETMAHRFMLGEGSGAAAVMGAAGITKITEDAAFGAMLQEYLSDGLALGPAIQQAKVDLVAERPEFESVILGWTLLGDPALLVAP